LCSDLAAERAEAQRRRGELAALARAKEDADAGRLAAEGLVNSLRGQVSELRGSRANLERCAITLQTEARAAGRQVSALLRSADDMVAELAASGQGGAGYGEPAVGGAGRGGEWGR